MLKRVKRIIEDPRRIVRAIERRMPGAISVGARARTKKINFEGLKMFKKQYFDKPETREFFDREVAARDLFSGTDWVVPIRQKGEGWIGLPLMPQDSVVTELSSAVDMETRECIAVKSLSALLDMYVAGWYHGDFHAGNLFWYEDEILVCDFEMMGLYDRAARPAFADCFDLTGNEQGIGGLRNPNSPKMFYSADTPSKTSLERVLGIPLSTALELFEAYLMNELRDACRGFRSRGARYETDRSLVYCSFKIPGFEVPDSECQRNSARRLEKYGVSEDELRNRSLLDLGCNVGSMIFESQKFGPTKSLGVEFDQGKVRTSNRVASYSGLNTVQFMQGNVDLLTLDDLGGEQFDVVYCFALIEHVKEPERLYQLLGRSTRNVLYFEGNSTTSVESAIDKLNSVGFREVTFLGNCDDDVKETNNTRPTFCARK